MHLNVMYLQYVCGVYVVHISAWADELISTCISMNKCMKK